MNDQGVALQPWSPSKENLLNWNHSNPFCFSCLQIDLYFCVCWSNVSTGGSAKTKRNVLAKEESAVSVVRWRLGALLKWQCPQVSHPFPQGQAASASAPSSCCPPPNTVILESQVNLWWTSYKELNQWSLWWSFITQAFMLLLGPLLSPTFNFFLSLPSKVKHHQSFSPPL